MLKNCEECNRVFSHPTRHLCAECYKQAQEDFNKVKEYLQENPNATIAEVVSETEVPLETIYEYIRQGRLDVVPRDTTLYCEICGAEISRGRLCANCAGELQKPPKEKSSRVHYLDRIKKRW